MSRTITALPPALTTLLFTAGPRAVLLLEGDDDRGVFLIWYRDRQDRLALFTAGEKFLVGEQVRLARLQGLARVFGVTDRDYTPDDAYAAEPEPGLFVLSRHELENYLVEAGAIQAEMAVVNPLAPPTVEAVAAQIDAWTEDAHSRTTANWILAPQQKTLLNDGQREPRPAVVRHLADALGVDDATADTMLAAKEAELRPKFADRTARHTVIEGKRLLHACVAAYFTREGLDRTRNRLAARTGVPGEIKRIVGGMAEGL